MIRMRLMWILVLFCLAVSPVLAEEVEQADEAAESQQPCETESGEPCAPTDDGEEELERGFDPCLINANLPACKSAEEPGDTQTSESARSGPDETGDSG